MAINVKRGSLNVIIEKIELMKQLFHNNNKQLKLYIFLIALITASWAIMQDDTTLAPPAISRMLSLNNWVCFLLLLFLTDYKKRANIYIIVVSALYFIIQNFHKASGIESSFSGILMFLLLCLFSFLSKSEMFIMLKWFRKYMIILSIVGVIIYIDFLFGIGIPHNVVEYYSSNHLAVYENYYVSYLFVENDGVRLCGLFNEPGYMGTTTALLLIIENFNFKRKGNIILFIAGFLTVSLAYFILIAIGFFFKIFTQRRKMAIAGVVSILFVFGIAFLDSNNVIKAFLTENFTYNKNEQTIGGHSREKDTFRRVLKQFNESGPLLFGYGSGYCRQQGVDATSSIRMNFVDWGYLGTALIYGLLLCAGFSAARGKREALIFLLCFTISIYQRPNVFTVFYFLILFGGICHIKIQEKTIRSAV